jgi:hypothetical protein
MKKFLTLILILFYIPTFADTNSSATDKCEYKGEFDECVQANAPG